MDDLVKKLRSQIGDDVVAIYDNEQLFRMAADEIERLRARAEAAEAERDENEAVIRVWRRRCEEAEAERDRMRAEAGRLTKVLEEIEAICDAALGGLGEIAGEDFRAIWYLDTTRNAWEVARAALSGGDDG